MLRYSLISLVVEVQKHLQFLVENPSVAKTLDVPDLSRKIIDTPEKQQSLQKLKSEIDELAIDIAREISPLFVSSQEAVQRRLMEAQVF